MLAQSFAPPLRTTPIARADNLLQAIGVRMAFAKDEEIYGQGEAANLIYLVASGAVRTSHFMVDGRRPIDQFYYPGDIFGLEVGDEHALAAEALSDCVLLVATRSALVAEGGERALQAMLRDTMVRDLQNTREHLMLLVCKTARQRVSGFLLGQAERSSDRVVELAMGRQDMADYLGLTIETVSRMITDLQNSHLVEFQSCRQFVVRDRKALAGIAVC